MIIKPKFDLSRGKAPAFIRRAKTHDVSIQFRMGAGFAGDVNRTHPASIAPYGNDTTSPVTAFGTAVQFVSSTGTVRAITTADNAGTAGIAGIAVRPFPFQGTSGTGDFAPAVFGGGAPLASMAIDVLLSGFIMVKANGTPTLGAPAYVWSAATSGNHVQGGFEVVNPSGSGVALLKGYWNGTADANGIAELAFNV